MPRIFVQRPAPRLQGVLHRRQGRVQAHVAVQRRTGKFHPARGHTAVDAVHAPSKGRDGGYTTVDLRRDPVILVGIRALGILVHTHALCGAQAAAVQGLQHERRAARRQATRAGSPELHGPCHLRSLVLLRRPQRLPHKGFLFVVREVLHELPALPSHAGDVLHEHDLLVPCQAPNEDALLLGIQGVGN